MARGLLEQIHELIKKKFPEATSVSILVNRDGMNVDAKFEKGRKVWRLRSVTGIPMDDLEPEEEDS